jgi:hypothetical protein
MLNCWIEQEVFHVRYHSPHVEVGSWISTEIDLFYMTRINKVKAFLTVCFVYRSLQDCYYYCY